MYSGSDEDDCIMNEYQEDERNTEFSVSRSENEPDVEDASTTTETSSNCGLEVKAKKK